MQDKVQWIITPPGGGPSASFPAIDAVRGEGGAARVLEGRQALQDSGLGLGLNREVLGGFGDEIGAAAGATADYVRGVVTGNGASWGDLYDEYLTIERGEQGAFREARPVSSLAANVAGGMVTGQGLTTSATTTAGRIAGGSAIGAVAGATQGFGEGEGGLGSRAESAAVGGLFGGALGAALPAVGDLIGRLGRGLSYVKGLKGEGARQRAAELLQDAMRADGVTVDDLIRAQASGKPVILADLGPNLRELAGTVSRQGGDARTTLENYLEKRTAGQYGRVQSDLTATAGIKGRDFAETGADIAAKRAAQAEAGYPAAYNQPAPALSPNAVSILATPDGKKAVATATRFMGNKRRPIQDEDGNYTVEMLDQIQRAMRDTATRASGARGAELAGNVEGLRGQFLGELPPDLRKVMSEYANASGMLDSLNAGRAFLRGDADEGRVAFQSLKPEQKDMFRLGAARELLTQMGNKADGADATAIFKKPNVRERIALMFPSRRMFQEFMDRAKTEGTMQETRNAVLKGSPTASRGMDDQRFAAGALGDAAADMAQGGGFVSGALRAAWNAGAAAKNRLLQGVNQAVADNIAKGMAGDTVAALRFANQLPAVTNNATSRALTATPAPTGAAAGVAAGGGGPAPQWVITPPGGSPTTIQPETEPRAEAPDFSASVKRVIARGIESNQPVPVMHLARAFTGADEVQDAKVLSAFMERFAGVRINPTETAWCAGFLNAVLGASGYEGTGKLNARSFMNWGLPAEKPTVGDVAVFSRGDPNGWQGHAGFFAGYKMKDGKRYIRVVGGNQNNSVSEKLYPESRLLGFRRPASTKSA